MMYEWDEPARAVLALLCMVRLAQFWLAGRRRWPILPFSLAALAPFFGCLWLALNVIRFYSYDGGVSETSVYSGVVAAQGAVVVLMAVSAAGAVLTGLAFFLRKLAGSRGRQVAR